ncbi:non-homologous end-joining DNA ligase [Actinophytocola algeriensis]|uniref:Bifunctional non-homologous end joining protein LigD n=1 Tax=Actinophytocola algeriensis TaxID=1768010 RepID=A0A7W7QA00_9PSEU|nr:non-homologous end-joining DNA ligase [Actinophytocola algeriensis]MBB4909785.1 bifunctional non-homologous end joining protein LigD [Actinophytocola algeriensis]MBE1475775.1 bifunctional non-homologous end joining protein LigD [Actinophytocola algeriensis]
MNPDDVELSNLDKPFFPDAGLSKGDVIAHYRKVADQMVPHLTGRPLTMRRYPDGIGGGGFFQKDASDHFPDWVRVEEVPQRQGGTIHHVVCDDAATLVYLANQATIEFHIWLSTMDALEHPDRLVIDIDPPQGVPVRVLRDVARRLASLYREVGLTPYVQATGGRGFHVAAPLDRSADYEETRELSLALADHVAARDPDLLTTAQRKNKRGDRIFLDVNRNAYGQTFVAPYTLRARPTAGVATPLTWDELSRTEPDGFTPARIARRRKKDPWQDMDDHAASVSKARKALAD